MVWHGFYVHYKKFFFSTCDLRGGLDQQVWVALLQYNDFRVWIHEAVLLQCDVAPVRHSARASPLSQRHKPVSHCVASLCAHANEP